MSGVDNRTEGPQVRPLSAGEFALSYAITFELPDDLPKTTGGDGPAFRVVAKEEPVTVVLECSDYREHTGDSTCSSSSAR
jgi:hypothetical protein